MVKTGIQEGEILVVGELDRFAGDMSTDIENMFEGRYKVRTSKDSRNIVERLKDRDHKLRLVVVDLDEKDIESLEVVRLIRSFDSELPIVVISETEDIRLAVEAAKSGAHDFISKPVTGGKIKEVIDDIEDQKEDIVSTSREALPGYIRMFISKVKNEMMTKGATLREATKDFEDRLVVFVLTKVKGDKVKASKILGLSDTLEDA